MVILPVNLRDNPTLIQPRSLLEDLLHNHLTSRLLYHLHVLHVNPPQNLLCNHLSNLLNNPVNSLIHDLQEFPPPNRFRNPPPNLLVNLQANLLVSPLLVQVVSLPIDPRRCQV